MGTSFYYRDPDGNLVEFSATNFLAEADFLAFLGSDAFRDNPSGKELDDPDAFVAKFRNGTPQSELVSLTG